MIDSKTLITECLSNNKFAQEKLYNYYSQKMFGVCMRFAKNRSEAEDILQEGFIKVFRNLASFRNEGQLEAWIRRIIVNTAINSYKRKLPSIKDIDFDRFDNEFTYQENIVESMSREELLRLVQELPNGYRRIFNLNAIEGYTHKEIGEMLDISINTSKSQLARARQALQKKIYRNSVDFFATEDNLLAQLIV
ncbi:MAG: RNA polymerase sigma factor [Bacteroidota bacterium]|nr:RNA polymerase sigma factor [Bacteroidota bacterium]